MEFIRNHQMNVMLVISSIVFMVLVFTIFLKFNNLKAKRALIAMEASAFIMVVMDRYAYIYRGNESTLGFWMVRISNFMVFLMILAEFASFVRYVIAVIQESDKEIKIPKVLKWADLICLFGVALLIISQFTGLYYTFDDTNHYQRQALFPVCYIIPLIIFFMVLITIIKLYDKLNRRIRVVLILFPIVIFIASIFQLFIYGISLNTLFFSIMTIVLFVTSIVDLNATVEEARDKEIEGLQFQTRNVQELFSQTVEALASAIDAKDKYTHGHSNRVAAYSVQLAKLAGKSETECEEIHFAAILHDVGKIGIPDAIINKAGKLTDEEFDIIKSHPAKGYEILSRITKRPYLSIGARYHHERYDGKGYPEHMKGEDIPEIARIISVADAYDAMTSIRSYRDPLPQQKVREEIIKGIGTQFDPTYGKLMLELIDSDLSYDMQEKDYIKQLDGKAELDCGEYRQNFTNGFRITECFSSIKFNCVPKNEKKSSTCIPSIIIFDSLNERVYQSESDIKATDYYEYGEILMNGIVSASADIRKVGQKKTSLGDKLRKYQYCVEGVKCKDHLLIRIDNGKERYEIIFALPDSSRYVYFALTGVECVISEITVKKETEPVEEGYIPRIAPKIVYLDMPDGDIPNIEVDNYRSESSQAIPITDRMTLDFTYKSLPTATRIWHGPMLRIFTSEDGSLDGPDYKPYSYIRFDGESWSEAEGDVSSNNMTVMKTAEFDGWDKWKTNNKKGVHSIVNIKRQGDKITVTTENGGVNICNITEIFDSPQKLYISITGDQCAVANIKIIQN